MQVETPKPCFIETTTALGISGNFLSSSVRDARYDTNALPSIPGAPIFRSLFPTFNATFFADQASAANGATMQGSLTGTSGWVTVAAAPLVASTPLTLSVPITYPFYRINFTNGATAQTSFSCTSSFAG